MIKFTSKAYPRQADTMLNNTSNAYSIKQPKFEALQKSFRVTLYQETTQEIETKNTTKQSICQLIRENKQITKIELAQKIGVSESAIKQQLATLKRAGTIKRIGCTKAGYWEISTNIDLP